MEIPDEVLPLISTVRDLTDCLKAADAPDGEAPHIGPGKPRVRRKGCS
ncbi:hypothetical protein [Microtetraspora malaysiensis]